MTKIENKKSLLSLLNILNEKNSKKPTKAEFLLNLLKEIKDKKLIKELIINSNLDKNTKEELFKFFDIKIENNIKIKNFKQTKIKKLPKINFQHNKNKQIIKINIKHNKPILKISENKKDKTIQNNSLLETLLFQTPISENLITKIEKEIKTKPQNTQKEIVKEIKTLIIMKKDNPIIKKIIVSKEFKEAKNFKDILNISKKFNLNLLKIAISQIKQPSKIIQTHKILNNQTSQIFTNKLKNNVKKPINPVNNDLTSKKSIISELFINKPQKISKDIKPKQDKNHKEDGITPQINISDIKPKIIEAKQTIKHFATSLKEAVENYKPPITKLTLELHPKEIGKVEVIIKQRGDNLQIQLNTNNQNTVNFFIQNQSELKNSLVNMGFTNINMNFNSNDQNKKQNHQKPQYSVSKIEDEEELVIDFTYKYA